MFLNNANSLEPAELLAWAQAELESRLRSGEPCRAEEFLSAFPVLSSDDNAAVQLIVAEYRVRCELGEKLDMAEWCAGFPKWRELLQRTLALPPHASCDTLRDSEGDDDKPDTLTAPAAPAAPLGQHEVYEQIGKGGMGLVFRARDMVLGREVALKRIRSDALTGPEVERFYREARAAAQLRHPNIVPIYAIGLHDGSPCYTMPLVTGGTLGDQRSRYREDPRAAAGLVAKVARAVHATHEVRVIHRDLKPGNILIDGFGEPLVADFGLAKNLDAGADLTGAGQVLGTTAYMPPEQLLGSIDELSAASDVWALGVILYELVRGERPFLGKGRMLEDQILGADPSWPRRLPRELGAIVLKCLEKQQADRYASAAALADDIDAWLDDRPTQARPLRGLQRARRTMRRHPVWTLCAAVLLLMAVVAPAARYATHPDRPLWRIQEQLRAGEAVDLIGPTGPPAWYRLWMGDAPAKAFVDNDGAFVVRGGRLTLIELLPDTCGHTTYDLHAEVRHLKGGDTGVVGLYFAGTKHRTTKGPVYSFLRLSYDDVHDVMDLHNRLPEGMRKQIPPPKGNSVQVLTQHYADRGKPDLANLHNAIVLDRPLFKPAGFLGQAGDWRPIRIEVSPKLIRILWAGELASKFTPDRVDELRRKDLANNPAFDGGTPELDLQGSVGLFLFDSEASFRNLRFAPR